MRPRLSRRDERVSVKESAESAALGWNEERLTALEKAHPRGLAMQEIVDAFGSKGDRLTEATFRKYVQLGLLPRSVRVGRKGKNRGSQGLYPVTVIRRIDTIRRLMAQGYTIEEIQKEFFFIRGDIEELTRNLTRVYGAIERVIGQRGADDLTQKRLDDARRHGDDLLAALDEIEQRVSHRARLARAHV